MASRVRRELRPAMTLAQDDDASQLFLLASAAGDYAFYRWHNIAINVWRSHPTGQSVDVLARLTADSFRKYPEGLSSVHWIDEGAGLPTAEARTGLSDIAARYERHLLCVGVLLRGSGFWASAVRSALTGIVLLTPKRFPLRFFADVTPLASFVAHEHLQRTGHRIGAERIHDWIERAARDSLMLRAPEAGAAL